tara:strand:- start:8913 stop:10670 length:1758 start_codon:yes stop_codon:yes gene_type:complete
MVRNPETTMLLTAICLAFTPALLSPMPMPARTLAPTAAIQMDRITGKPFATRSEVFATHGMAATSHPHATQVALDVLKAGGSAVDAAIAANAVLGCCEPTGCGIGGDLFAIVWDAESKSLSGLNGSGRSPASLSLEHLRELGLSSIPKRGPLPVSVPGCVDGWFRLHERFGKLPMPEVLAPAIAAARDGIPVPQTIAYYWGLNARSLAKYPGFADTYMPGGKAPGEGEVFRNPRLARTYERLAEGGRSVFYEGEIAQEIADYMQAQGGFLTVDDLAAHQGEWVEPVSTTYRGYRLWELPPNGQGIAALQMLNILEGFDLAGMGWGSADHLHHFIEAKKLAFEDRARFYADPAMADVPVARLISKEHAAEQRARIDPKRAALSIPTPNPALEEGDTIYLTVADAAGNMVSLIQSNYRGMGSGMTPGDLGFILQNRGELFDLTAGRANTYEPRKRPFHTIIPAFVTKDGEPWLSYGVMGGATQPQMHAWVLSNIVDFGMNLQEAGDAARLVHLGSSQPTGERMDDGGRVALETGFDLKEVAAFLKRGHRRATDRGVYGGYQAIARDTKRGIWVGASESRKDGAAAGY